MAAEHLRQWAIMLQLVFHLGQLLDDALAIFSPFVIIDSSNSPMEVINCPRLSTSLAIE